MVSGCLASIIAALWWWKGEAFYIRWLLESPSSGRCQKHLNRETLQASLELGTRFLLAHQRPAGNFDYEYDWRAGTLSEDDQETRQAGALWGLTLLHQHQAKPELAAAIEQGLSFFSSNTREGKSSRCLAYPGSRSGRTGTMALLALANIETLRQAQTLRAERRQALEAELSERLSWLLDARHPNGLWYSEYDVKTCKPRGAPSSYSDGEALLALVKAAKYLNRRDLLPAVMASAAAGKHFNVDEALSQNPDSDITKGYYQWSTMAFYELATSDFPDVAVYGDTVLRLADWVIDDHDILTRSRNTGYAYEGIVHAYAWAKQRGDTVRQAKYGCVIDLGLEHIMSWQVGSPVANSYASRVKRDDVKALGGVQNAAFEPGLRVDVTQHQMHATLLALRYVYP